MKRLEIELIDDKITIGFENLKRTTIEYKRKIETVMCCKEKIFTEGCIISIPSIPEICICHNCLFDLYELLFNNYSAYNIDSICKLRIIENELYMNKAEMKLFIKKIEQYLYYLYTENLSYDIFETMTPVKEKLVQRFKNPISLKAEEIEYFNSLTEGLKKEYLLSKSFSKIKNGYKKKMFSQPDRSTSNINRNFQVYCMMSNIQCKSSSHNNDREAVLVLTNKSVNGFTFSFCSDCLYNFGLTLLKIYSDPNVKEYQRNHFKVEQNIIIDNPCLISGIKQKEMYRVYIYNSSFVLCKKYFNLLSETILSSAAFRELFPDKYAVFKKVSHTNEVNEDIILRNQMLEEKKQAQKVAEEYKQKQEDLKRQYQIKGQQFTAKLSDLQREIDDLKRQNDGLIKESTNQKKVIHSYVTEKIRRKEAEERKQEKLIEYQNQKKRYFEEHILNCAAARSSILNLKMPKMNKHSLKYNGLLKITANNDFSCRTLKHLLPTKADVIIETYQKNDPLCLAICNDCIRDILNGFKQVDINNTYYCDWTKNMEIRYIKNNNSATVCHSCGKKENSNYYVRLCNVAFHLCENCKSYWIVQLSKSLI